jgi:hypothetical protein
MRGKLARGSVGAMGTDGGYPRWSLVHQTEGMGGGGDRGYGVLCRRRKGHN